MNRKAAELTGFEFQETPSSSAPGPRKPVSADPSWTPLEAWVWQKLQAGEIANIDHYHDDQGALTPADPKNADTWQDGRRRLSAGFLEAILLEDPYRGAVHRKGVRIDAAWFDQEIDLVMAELKCVLWLDRCRFEPLQRLAHLEAARDVTFDGSVFVNQVDLQGARIGGNLFFRNVTASAYLNLRMGKIGGLVDFSSAKIAGKLDMNGVNVGQGLLMRSAPSGARAEFHDVDLVGAKVSGQVNLIGAIVTGMLEFGGAAIDRDLFMSSDSRVSERQAEFGEVSMRAIRIRGQLAQVGTKVSGRLDLSRAEIGRDLLMQTDPAVSEHRATYENVDLPGAMIHGDVNLDGAHIRGSFVMVAAVIEQGLFMSSKTNIRAEFTSVNLQRVVVGGAMMLAGAKVTGTLDMTSSDIGQTLDMGSADRISTYRTELNEVLLRGARIGGQLSLSGSMVAGVLDMDSAKIENGLFLNYDPEVSPEPSELHDVRLWRARIDGGLSLRGASAKGALAAIAAVIEGDVLLGGANVGQIDLHGARITGELNLTSPMPTWRKQDGAKPVLNLRNASCDAVQDNGQVGAWPDEIELDGFTYKRFGGLGADFGTDVAKRGSTWFLEWLAKGQRFTRQPYYQCASVLRGIGHPEMANDVLYEGRERERHEIWARWPGEQERGLEARLGRSLKWLKTMLFGRHPWGSYDEIRRSFRWFGLSILAFVVGYGYGTRLFWRPLVCAALIVAIGIRVTYSDASAFADSSILWRTFFSLDMLLPIVELSPEHSTLQARLDGLAYGWFVIQRLLGWVLALFLIAGLSGLTK